MDPYLSEDDLPELSAILAPRPLMATSANTSLRRSPRKKGSLVSDISASPKKKQPVKPSPQKTARPAPIQTVATSAPAAKSTVLAPSSSLGDIPRLTGGTRTRDLTATSSNRRSPARTQRTLVIPRVDSLLLPRSAISKQEYCPRAVDPDRRGGLGSLRVLGDDEKSMMSLMTEAARKSQPRQRPRKRVQPSSYASRFILNEARCNDDEEDSMGEEDEDEDTDLSGFIVDDDAELSYHDSSASESEIENRRPDPPRPAPRRKLHRGSPVRRRLSFRDDGSDNNKENLSTDALADALGGLDLEGTKAKGISTGRVRVIDLTSSPIASPHPNVNGNFRTLLTHPSLTFPPSGLSNSFDGDKAVPRLDPSVPQTTMAPPSKINSSRSIEVVDHESSLDQPGEDEEIRFKTPPRTPPKPRLNSPSKLLSPSKRPNIPRSPHRPSMDAFWDHNVINDWHDEYSPKKIPAKSPRKGLAQFLIHSDSEEDEKAASSSDSLPSPCSSPRKSKSRSQSPLKSPEKEEKKRLLQAKKAAIAKKKAFDARKEQLALELLEELDTKVAKSRLSGLASSTGGVRIVWSKTLRSTAGRANWRRTANKVSGSPIKGGVTEGPGVEIKHFASIELAEKIIDCEDRLVNTLAHEFCHLTNFMISNVRDQPHGTSFKAWATRVTDHLRTSDVEMWRQVEVTTKHSYAINHKYLWVCTGREQTQAMEMLNIDEDDGCGAEYGRHSKSIDPGKHRCGRCRGLLVQVRPKPRAVASPRKQLRDREGSAESSESGSAGSQSTLGGLVEVVELSD